MDQFESPEARAEGIFRRMDVNSEDHDEVEVILETAHRSLRKSLLEVRDNMKKVQFLRETELGTGEYGATALADLTGTEFKQNHLGWKKQRDDPEVHWPAAEIPDVALPKVVLVSNP